MGHSLKHLYFLHILVVEYPSSNGGEYVGEWVFFVFFSFSFDK